MANRPPRACATSSVMAPYFAELYRYRDLLVWLAAKEVKVRYKLPVLGFLWAFLVPLLLSLILWFIFSRVLPTPTASAPFFLFLLTGMFPWSFFAQTVSQATMSILEAGPLVRKTAFPRAVIPLSIVAANFINFLLSLTVLLAMLVACRVPLSPWLWLLPFVMAIHAALTVGVVLLVAGLQVRYRDVKYFTEVALLLGFYVTPIFYPLELVARSAPALHLIYLLNPFVYLVELYRAALLGAFPGVGTMPPLTALAAAAVASLVLLSLGAAVFRRQEPAFADWVAG